jgi:hypothetical protein
MQVSVEAFRRKTLVYLNEAEMPRSTPKLTGPSRADGTFGILWAI